MSTKMEVSYTEPVSAAPPKPAAADPPVVIVLRAHGQSLPHNPQVSQNVMSLFSDSGQITLLRKARIGISASNNERSWQQLFQIIQDAKTHGTPSYEELLRIITQRAVGVPEPGDPVGISTPFRITSISHGIEQSYTFYESERPQNSRALGVYDTDELNKLIPPGQGPSGIHCGLVLQRGNSALPLGEVMPVTFDNTLLNIQPELTHSPFRQYTLSEIAIDLKYRYPNRKIILIEVSCRGGDWTKGITSEDASLTSLTAELGEMSLISPESTERSGAKLKRKRGGRTHKKRTINHGKNKKTRRHNKK